MKKVTIVDVARLAGVSTATVSRAMHTPNIVRPATLDRVSNVIRDCGYVYNATAGDFSRRKSTVIGVLVLSTTTKVAASLSAAQQVATERQFPLITSTSGFDPRLERKHLQQFLQRGVAGILVIGHMTENLPRILEIQEQDVSCVFLWETLPERRQSYIGFNNIQGQYTMVSHLISEGYRRIGFICGINAGVRRIANRYIGYKNALLDNDLPLDEDIICSCTSTYENGRAAMQELMALADPPRCVCCASDVLAVGAMAAVHEAGLSVPYDYSVAGFDNADFAAYQNPGLTTVDVPGEEMGHRGMEALLALISNEEQPSIQEELPTTLVLRASTCPAARQNKHPQRVHAVVPDPKYDPSGVSLASSEASPS